MTLVVIHAFDEAEISVQHYTIGAPGLSPVGVDTVATEKSFFMPRGAMRVSAPSMVRVKVQEGEKVEVRMEHPDPEHPSFYATYHRNILLPGMEHGVCLTDPSHRINVQTTDLSA